MRVLCSAASIALLFGLALTALGPFCVGAQPAPRPLRLASLTQWSVNQHRSGWSATAPVAADPRQRLANGVVDRPVFWWQRALIQRSALARKPIRVLSTEEAAPLGGRGAFDLSVRPPPGPSAWVELTAVPRGGDV